MYLNLYYVLAKDTYKFKNGGETRAKFFKILHDGEVHGKKLTDKQRKFFGAMAFKKYAVGGDNFQDKYFSQYQGEMPFEMIANMVNGIPGYDDIPYTPPLEWNQKKENKNIGPLSIEDLQYLEDLKNEYTQQYHANDWLKNPTAQWTVDPRVGNTQNDSFIGPPNYPDKSPIQQNGEWVFTPQRVDYNKKYVSLPKKQSTTSTSSTQLSAKPVNKSTTPATQSTATNTQTQSKPVAPQTKEYLPKKRVDDIWNNPNGSDVVPKQKPTYVPTWDLGYRKNLPKQNQINYPKDNRYLPKYQDGGLNEGMEADLSESEIQDLISKGYKIEIL